MKRLNRALVFVAVYFAAVFTDIVGWKFCFILRYLLISIICKHAAWIGLLLLAGIPASFLTITDRYTDAYCV